MLPYNTLKYKILKYTIIKYNKLTYNTFKYKILQEQYKAMYTAVMCNLQLLKEWIYQE